ncbi:MAG: heavy metal translocating P-type ATPase, partial [Anaeroglobus sp.]
MYNSYKVPLRAFLPTLMRPILAAQLRRIRGVVAASADDKEVVLYYKGLLDMRAITRFIRQFEDKRGVKKEEKSDLDASAYRREAILSVGGFIAMNILNKTNPEFYASMLLVRRLFTLFIARRFIKNGIAGIIEDKQANADTLTATAVIASVLSGKPESSLTLLALSNGAEMLTEYAAEKARSQISSLLKLDQRDVWLVEDGRERKVPVDSLKPGDCIAVHLGEKICVDGKVIGGNAAVNQASITGESAPAIKQEGSSVYAGSVIEAGDLVMTVEKVGKDTSLAQIIHLVEEAQTRRAPVQNFADKMANMLVPVSFIGAAIIYGATKDWQRVLNLLFIDFSCGLKLSTATAISAAIGVAAKQGILIKGGNYIENLSNVDTVVLDKTGTITIGVPQISHIETREGVSKKEIILSAASAEMHSVHPLAVAI